MDALTALRNKRDTRSYEDRPVDPALLSRLIDAARMAGSAKNLQPVRMVVVTDHDAKVALKASGDFASWIDRAPIVVVVTVQAFAGPRRMFDVGRHAQNLMVAAYAEGVATCPVTIHHPEVARATLGIPADVEPAMIITLGWPAPNSTPSPIAGPRVDIDTYVSWERWT
jgi:nitroreductase